MLDRVGGGFKDYAPFILRLGMAIIFIGAGAHSLVNLSSNPPAWRIAVAAIEILGGLFCLIGFLTRWAAFALGALMIYLIVDGPRFAVINQWGDQIYLACLTMSAALFGLGGGKWSVDDSKKKKD